MWLNKHMWLINCVLLAPALINVCGLLTVCCWPLIVVATDMNSVNKHMWLINCVLLAPDCSSNRYEQR